MRKPPRRARTKVDRRIGLVPALVESDFPPVDAAVAPGVTVENCLKAALRLSLDSESKWVGTGQLANVLGLAPSTVSLLLKNLSESGFAVYKPYAGISLTDRGHKLAARILRRHRLIETFLTRVLKLPWDEVHDEAEKMEHAVSDRLIDRIDGFLECPSSDPHGDPIPAVDGTMRGTILNARPLVNLEPVTPVRFVRVLNQKPSFLRYLSSCGIEIGTGADIELNEPQAGTITIRIKGKPLALSRDSAAQLLVEAQ